MAASNIHVTLSAAISIDGKIATRTRDSELSSRTDVIRVHKLRACHDAILVGINTVRIDDPLLTVRYAKGKNPIRVILDTQATLSSSSKIAQSSQDTKTIVIVSSLASSSNIKRLRNLGINVIKIPSKHPRIQTILARLYDENIRTLLVEGGSSVNWEFIQSGFIDKAIICICPYFVGGLKSTSLVGGLGFGPIAESLLMKLDDARRVGDELVMFYSRKNKSKRQV